MESKIFLGIFTTPINYLKFSGGEIQIQLTDYEKNYLIGSEAEGQVNITAHIKCSEGIILLSQLKNLVDSLNLNEKVSLKMPYVPYARYDRAMVSPDSFSLKVFANLLNSLNFDEVIVQDCHSEVTTDLINNCINLSQYQLIKDVFDFSSYDLIVAPDKGSLFKAARIAKLLNKELIICNKVRDQTTGSLSLSYDILSRTNIIKGKNVLILDDICDGGGTFMLAGKELLKYKPNNLGLCITHGIFSKGVDTLKEVFDEIYAYNLWKEDLDIQYNIQF